MRAAHGLEVVEALRGAARGARRGPLRPRGARHGSTAEDALPAVEARLAERGVRTESLRRIEPTLEHVFIAAVQESGGVIDG